MSVRALGAVWRVECAPLHKFLLLALADHANDETFDCWPSLTHLTKKTGMGRSTIARTLSALEEAGFITREQREKTSTRYVLNVATWSQSGTSARAGLVPERDIASPRAGLGSPRAGLELVPERDHKHQSNHHRTINEPSIIATGSKTRLSPAPKAKPDGSQSWDAYALAYLNRYGTEPLRNARVNGQLAQFAKRVPADEAPHVARWYVASNTTLYVRSKHCVDLLLRDCEGLRTEWATSRRVTDTDARQADQHQAAQDAARWVADHMDDLRKARAEGKL